MGFTKGLLGFFSHDLGIDLGASNSKVHIRGGEGFVEPSVLAVEKNTNRILLNGHAIGETAQDMPGRTPSDFTTIHPIKEEQFTFGDMTLALLEYLTAKAHGFSRMARPRVLIATPTGTPKTVEQGIKDTLKETKIRRAWCVPNSIAAAVGAGMPADYPTGNIIVDIGSNTSEIAVISMMGIVCSTTLRIAGDTIDNAIIKYLDDKYDLIVGESTAENIKIEIGSADTLPEERSIEVKGRNHTTGTHKAVTIGSAEIREVIKQPLERIIKALSRTINAAPPKLADDIYSNGIMLAGGTASLPRLDAYFRKELGDIVEIKTPEQPIMSVAKGLGVFIDGIEDYEELFGKYYNDNSLIVDCGDLEYNIEK